MYRFQNFPGLDYNLKTEEAACNNQPCLTLFYGQVIKSNSKNQLTKCFLLNDHVNFLNHFHEALFKIVKGLHGTSF